MFHVPDTKEHAVLGYVHTKTIVNANDSKRIFLSPSPHEDDQRGAFKFIHFGVRFRIYAFAVSVFIVFVWTEGLSA